MSISLADQRTVTTWPRLLAQGWTPSAIRAQLAARRWRRWGYAIVLHSGELSRKEQWYVARAHGGPGALLTAFTAAEAYGLRGWERDDTWVLSRPGSHVSGRSPVGLQVRRVADWDAVRRHPRGPVHVLSQALLVAAASFPSNRPACGLLAAAVQQGAVTPNRLVSSLDAAPRLRHRAMLRLALADIGQGAEALSEIDFAALCRRRHLPPPQQQAVRKSRGGKRRYLDATWRRADGKLVVVEVDGALHLAQRRWWDDQLRQNEIALSGALVLRYPSVIVRVEPELVARQLRQALAIS